MIVAGDFTVYHNDFFKYIDQLIEYTGIERVEVYDKCYDIYVSNHLTASDLLQISENLNVDPVLLWNKQIDFETLKKVRSGDYSLPSSYSDVRASSMVSLKNTLEQFKKYDLYNYALKRLQIDEKAIASNSTISVLAGADLLEFSKGFFTKKEYADIGRRNAAFSFKKLFRHEISSTKSAIYITREMMSLLGHFEQNWDYKILHSDLKSVIVETNESDYMRSAKSYKSYTNEFTTFIRFSYFRSALESFNIKGAYAVPISDWNNRDKKFRFSINIR